MKNKQPQRQMSTAARVFMLSTFLLALSGCSTNDEEDVSTDNSEEVIVETDEADEAEGSSPEQEQVAERATNFFADVADQGVDVKRILELEGHDVEALAEEERQNNELVPTDDETNNAEEPDVDDETNDNIETNGNIENTDEDEEAIEGNTEEDDEEEVMSSDLREYFIDTYGDVLDTYFHGDTAEYSDDELMSRVQTIINASLFVGGIDVSELYADEDLAEAGAYDQFEDLGQPVVEAAYADIEDDDMTASIQVFPLDLFRSIEPGLRNLDDDELIDIIVSEGGAPAQFVLNFENVDDQWWVIDDFGEPMF